MKEIKIKTLCSKRILQWLLPAVAMSASASGQPFSVNNNNDFGVGSLRQAVLDANTISTATEAFVYIDFQAAQIAAFPARAEILLFTGDLLPTRPIVFVAGTDYPKPNIRPVGSRAITVAGSFDGTIIFQNIRFEGSRYFAAEGGVIHCTSTSSGTKNLEFYGCEFVDNVLNPPSGSVSVNCNGGAIYFSRDNSAVTTTTQPLLKIENCVFDTNRVGSVSSAGIPNEGAPNGAAIFVRNSRFTMTGSKLINHSVKSNSALYGAALSIEGGIDVAEVSDCYFGGNIGSGNSPSGICLRTASVTWPFQIQVKNTTFKGNDGTATVQLNGTASASAPSIGTFENSTFVANNGYASGGISSFLTFGEINLTHCTFYQNTHDFEYGAAVRHQGTDTELRVSRSVIAGNRRSDSLPSVSTSPDITLASGIISDGYNLIGNGKNVESIFTKTGDTCGSEAVPLDPQLAGPADFGGGMETCPPLPGSPLVDAIPPIDNVLMTDQIGHARLQGNLSDVGAIELPRVPFSFWNAQISNPKDRGATSDPDKDGMNNLLEYYFGTNPNVAELAPVKMIMTESGLFFEVIRSATVRPAAFTQAELQVSTTLEAGGWLPLHGIQASSPVIPGVLDRIRSLYPINSEGYLRQFFRVAVE